MRDYVLALKLNPSGYDACKSNFFFTINNHTNSKFNLII
jgi:hypothetical protein